MTSHALLANGGVMAPVGMRLVAMAAKRHSVPSVVLVGIYKLSPLFPHEPEFTFNDFKNPADILPYQDPAALAGELGAAREDAGAGEAAGARGHGGPWGRLVAAIEGETAWPGRG